MVYDSVTLLLLFVLGDGAELSFWKLIHPSGDGLIDGKPSSCSMSFILTGTRLTSGGFSSSRL